MPAVRFRPWVYSLGLVSRYNTVRVRDSNLAWARLWSQPAKARNGWLVIAPCQYESQFRCELHYYWKLEIGKSIAIIPCERSHLWIIILYINNSFRYDDNRLPTLRHFVNLVPMPCMVVVVVILIPTEYKQCITANMNNNIKNKTT